MPLPVDKKSSIEVAVSRIRMMTELDLLTSLSLLLRLEVRQRFLPMYFLKNAPGNYLSGFYLVLDIE